MPPSLLLPFLHLSSSHAPIHTSLSSNSDLSECVVHNGPSFHDYITFMSAGKIQSPHAQVLGHPSRDLTWPRPRGLWPPLGEAVAGWPGCAMLQPGPRGRGCPAEKESVTFKERRVKWNIFDLGRTRRPLKLPNWQMRQGVRANVNSWGGRQEGARLY